MDLKKSEGGGITRLLPDGRLGSHYCAYQDSKANVKASLPNTANESNMNRCFPHHVMASVPQQGQDCKQESFSDLLSSVLSPDEATVGFEAAACVDLSALDGLNLDFPPLNSNNSNNYSSVSEVVAAAIMATSSEDTLPTSGGGSAASTASTHQPQNFSSSGSSSMTTEDQETSRTASTKPSYSIMHRPGYPHYPVPPSGHFGQYSQHHLLQPTASAGLDNDNSSLCSSPSPPSTRPPPPYFYQYQGSFYGHHHSLQAQASQPPFAHKGPASGGSSHCGSSAGTAATLHVVVNSSSPSSGASNRPSQRSPVGAGSGGGGAGVGLPADTKQPQLLLMRVSSVKSSRSSHDNESSNNNKRGTGGNQGSQQHKDIDQVGQRTTTINNRSRVAASTEDNIHHHHAQQHHQQGIEYGAAAAQQGDLADHLLQQCLVPVVPNPRELTGGLWFRCRLCNRVELTSKLSSHARQYHHTDHVTDCIASLDGQNGGQQQSGVNPAWCDGAFPTDLEDVTLSPTNNVNKQLTSAASAAAGSAAAGSGFEPTTSSSCSPPSVTDLTNLNPDSKYFDPDFDVVDDMKFIDSLIRTMPEDQQQQPHSSEHLVNSYQTSSNKSNNTANGLDHHVIYPQQQQQQPPLPSSAQQAGPASAAGCSAAAAQASSSQAPGSMGGTSTTSSSTKSSSKKNSPQFRWRRRKRRSKAQYPEMGRYLLPIDDGEEVQHLGRTLECTLCGLRGKRCHLTLHFKAKHNEVIDIAGVHGSRKQTNNKQPSKTTQQPQTQPPQPPPTRPDLCWQPPPSMQQHIGSLETHEIKIEQPQLIQSQQRGSNISGLRGHLPTLSSASATGVLTSPSTVNEDTTTTLSI